MAELLCSLNFSLLFTSDVNFMKPSCSVKVSLLFTSNVNFVKLSWSAANQVTVEEDISDFYGREEKSDGDAYFICLTQVIHEE